MNSIPLTKHGADLLKEELHRLKTKERPAVISAIAEARAQSEFRYLFAAFFSSGVMMPMGFEYGPGGTLDLTTFIAGVNGMKAGIAALLEEGERATALASEVRDDLLLLAR